MTVSVQHLVASRRMNYYAFLLVIIGTLGYVSNRAKAGSALISGVACGGVSLMCSYLMYRGVPYSATLTVVVLVLLDGVFGWRAFLAWSAFLSGQHEKIVPAGLTSAMFALTLYVLPTVLAAAKQKSKKTN
eukprot:TRINITY_DN8342_c0_g1_i1.p1 TRINITY_DN8342_c0_g1~~TRINITY_DN8342_c0_g1_i1.p1  ORF type:complete len:131 (+),score=13.44 TRINITY_DN8342_c0_g1_i1:22-414(+)